MTADEIPTAALAWTPCHRLIASRYPTVGLYDDIARPEDLEVVFAIAAGQALGRGLREDGSPALVYDSVRRPGGQCVAVFKPRALANPRPAGHVSLHWDGERITHWWEKGEPHSLAG